MSFIRPEIVAVGRRWRETLGGAVVTAVGLWFLADGLGVLFWFGAVVTLFGLGLIVSGIPRARARIGGGGSGVVDVDERRITYFGPVSGGAMALEEITRIAADPGKRWVLTSVTGEFMTVPMDAEGADQLFDAFAALPGLSHMRLAAATGRDVPARRVIWERPHVRLG